MRVSFPQLHERERNAHDHATHAEQRHGEQWGVCSDVNGSGFGTDALVYWGMATRTTTYVSTSQVKANITDADIMNAGMVQVYVRSGGANSNAMPFTITP